MKEFWLTEEELRLLQEVHRLERTRNARAAYKLNAVILLGSGWKLKDVKEALLIDDETLRSYVDKYRTGGVSALLETHYTGRLTRLSTRQMELLEEELARKIYLTT